MALGSAPHSPASTEGHLFHFLSMGYRYKSIAHAGMGWRRGNEEQMEDLLR